jgi:hypothetical protein
MHQLYDKLNHRNTSQIIMPDHGRCFINLYGNSDVDALTKEVNKRLDAHDPATAIGQVLYGLPIESAKLTKQVTGSDWVRPAQGEFGDVDQICLVNSTDIPEKLENHLVWFYSKIDPNVVLRNKYDSDRGEFLGVRFKIVRNGKILTFQRHKWIDKSVVFELDPDEEDEITWVEFWDIQYELSEEALSELVEKFPFVANYLMIR